MQLFLYLFCLFFQFESNPQASVFKVAADDFKFSDFVGMGDMCTDTSTKVVVADAYHTEGFSCILWQLAQVYVGRNLLSGKKFDGYGQISGNHFIDFCFYLCYLFGSRCVGKQIVAFAFFLFDMGIFRAFTTE